jgi:hypothetical protein
LATELRHASLEVEVEEVGKLFSRVPALEQSRDHPFGEVNRLLSGNRRKGCYDALFHLDDGPSG